PRGAWWYGRGLKDLFSFLSALFSYTSNMFSVKTLLRTLFSPWKKMVGEREKGIEGLKLWLLDSFISRIVGFMVRIVMMILFFLAFLVFAIFAVLAIVFWICMPAILVASFIYIFIGYR
ncbi:MAG: hypothetical protein AAB632_03245, partial [Patescibacteria group bacterium]